MFGMKNKTKNNQTVAQNQTTNENASMQQNMSQAQNMQGQPLVNNAWGNWDASNKPNSNLVQNPSNTYTPNAMQNNAWDQTQQSMQSQMQQPVQQPMQSQMQQPVQQPMQSQMQQPVQQPMQYDNPLNNVNDKEKEVIQSTQNTSQFDQMFNSFPNLNDMYKQEYQEEEVQPAANLTQNNTLNDSNVYVPKSNINNLENNYVPQDTQDIYHPQNTMTFNNDCEPKDVVQMPRLNTDMNSSVNLNVNNNAGTNEQVTPVKNEFKDDTPKTPLTFEDVRNNKPSIGSVNEFKDLYTQPELKPNTSKEHLDKVNRTEHEHESLFNKNKEKKNKELLKNDKNNTQSKNMPSKTQEDKKPVDLKIPKNIEGYLLFELLLSLNKGNAGNPVNRINLAKLQLENLAKEGYDLMAVYNNLKK